MRLRIIPALAMVAALCICATAVARSRNHDRTASRPAPAADARIDINHASVDELMKVPGMTRSWAGRIVRFRPYRSKQDLLERGVVPSAVYDRIKNFVIAHRNKE